MITDKNGLEITHPPTTLKAVLAPNPISNLKNTNAPKLGLTAQQTNVTVYTVKQPVKTPFRPNFSLMGAAARGPKT